MHYLSDPSTISYVTYGLGIISNIPVGEIMYTKNNTFSWNSTTADGIILMKHTLLLQKSHIYDMC